MNIYLINPKWIDSAKFHSFLEILKVKTIISFINEEDCTKNLLPKYPAIKVLDFAKTPLRRYGNNFEYNKKIVDEFLQQAVYEFIRPFSTLAEDTNGKTVICKVKDAYKQSTFNNPIYNIEKLDDPNILILYNSYKNEHPLYRAVVRFKKYAFSILDKYCPQFDYKHRIAFVNFDEFLFSNSVGNSDYSFRARYYSRDSVKKIDDLFCPMLVYLNLKANQTQYKEQTLQELFLRNGAKRAMEKFVIKSRNAELQSKSCSYDCDDSNDWGQESELVYIYENGGDWILD